MINSLGTDKILPDSKARKKEGPLDVTQEVGGSPGNKKEKDSSSGPSPGHFDSPVISEAGDSDGLKISKHANKEKKNEEEIKKSKSKEEAEKQQENDVNYKRKVLEEMSNRGRKSPHEENEGAKKAEEKKEREKKNEKEKKPEKECSPILKCSAKSPAKSPKSRSDSRKKKKSKIRDEINGPRKPEYIKQQDDDNNSNPKHGHKGGCGGGGRARTPGLECKDDHRKRDESEELILNMLRENREKEQQRSGQHIHAPPFEELEHPRPRSKQHELIRSHGRDQRDSHNRSARSTSCPKKKISDRHDKTAPSQQPPSESKYFPVSRRREQCIIFILSCCLLATLVVITIQAAFITSKCGLKQ